MRTDPDGNPIVTITIDTTETDKRLDALAAKCQRLAELGPDLESLASVITAGAAAVSAMDKAGCVERSDIDKVAKHLTGLMQRAATLAGCEQKE